MGVDCRYRYGYLCECMRSDSAGVEGAGKTTEFLYG